jgi:Domain of unknown function (DUF6924)
MRHERAFTRSDRQTRCVPILPERTCSLLVCTDFTSDDVWQQVADKSTRENEDGFRAYAEPVSDPAFDAASWETVKAAVPANSRGASVLFIADSISLSSPDHPVLVVDLSDTFLSVAEFPEIAGRTPFRCIPSELWSVDNNLNIANMDWEDFAGSAGEDGVFRGFGCSQREILAASSTSAHRHEQPSVRPAGRGAGSQISLICE